MERITVSKFYTVAIEVIMKWGEQRWPQMKALDRSKVVTILPTGSMEQHGPHLPLQVDHFIANRIAEDLEKRMPEILTLPPVWAGTSGITWIFPARLHCGRGCSSICCGMFVPVCMLMAFAG